MRNYLIVIKSPVRNYLIVIPSLILILLSLSAGPALAATYYLDANGGNDGYVGSSGAPWQTLAKAQAVAQSGDVIILRNGNYGDFVDSVSSSRNNWITYRSDNGHNPVFNKISVANSTKLAIYLKFDGITVQVPNPDPWPDPANSSWPKTDVVYLEKADYVELVNCTIRGCNKYLTRHGVKVMTSDHVTVDHCDISVVGAGTLASDCRYHTLSYNHVHDMSEGSGMRIQASQLSAQGIAGTIIRGNHIHGQRADSGDDYFPSGYHPGSGISIRISNMTITDNVVHDGFAQGIMFYCDEPGLMPYINMVLENNLFYDTGFNRLRNVGGSMVVRNNTFIGCINDDRQDNKYGILWRYSGMPLHVNFADGFDGTGVEIYNNVVVGPWDLPGPDGYNYQEDYNLFWRRGGDPFYSTGKGAHTKIVVWRDNSSPYTLHGWPEFFEDLDLQAGAFTPEWPGGDPYQAFFVDPRYYTNSQVSSYQQDHGLVCDYRLADGSAGATAGGSAYATYRGLGSTEADGFIRQDGTVRDTSQPSVGCYEYGEVVPGGSYTISLNAIGNGTISKSPDSYSYPDGTEVTLTATAGTGYSFETWSGGASGTTNPVVITMDASKSVTATFHDMAGPTVESVGTTSNTHVQVVFNEPTGTASAQNTGHYSISGGMVVTAAVLQADQQTVLLTTTQHSDDETYSLTITNVEDQVGNSMAPVTIQYSYKSGLVGHWKLDEAGGGTAVDSSGTDNTGTLIGGPNWTDGKLDGALELNGTNDCINCSNGASLNEVTAITISAWIRITDPWQNAYMRIVSKKNAWDSGSGYELEINPYRHYLTILGSGSNYARAENVALDTAWHHVAATITDTTGRVYIDGQECTTDYTIGALVNNTNEVYIGRQSGGGSYFQGCIDNVRIHNYALSATEISQMYNDDLSAGGGEPTNQAPTANDQTVTLDQDTFQPITLSGSDPDGDTLSYTIVSSPGHGTLAGSAPMITYTPAVGYHGDDVFTFKVSDGEAESNEATVGLTISAAMVIEELELDPIGNRQVNENTTLVITITASGGTGEIIYDAVGLPDGSMFEEATFTWPVGYDDAGSYQVTFGANDGTSVVSETITITANNVNRSPDISNIPVVLEKTEGGEITRSEIEQALDPDGDELSYSYSGWINTLPYAIGYDQSGSYSLNVAVSDGSDIVSKDITVVVANVNQPPELSPIGNQQVMQDTSLTFTVIAVDPDGDPVNYWAEGLPTGAALTGSVFSWIPPVEALGSHTLTVWAGDGELSIAQALTITVISSDSDSPEVVFTSPNPYDHETPSNTLIVLHIADDKSGVDPNTVRIKVENKVVYSGNNEHYTSEYGNCYRGGTTEEYTFSYQPAQSFAPDQIIDVKVAVSDKVGNCLSDFDYCFYTQSCSFGAHTTVSDTTNEAGQAATATDSAGNVWAGWHAGPEGARGIYVARFGPDAKGFEEAVRINDYQRDQCNPVIATDGNDRIYVAWQYNRKGQWWLLASNSSDGTNWSRSRRVSHVKANQCNAAIAAFEPGHVAIAWQDDRNGNEDIYLASSNDGFDNTTVTAVTSDTSNQITPAVTIDGNSRVHVVWTDMRNVSGVIYGASSHIGPWVNIAIVNNGSPLSNPALAAERNSSSIHLLWVDETDGNADIYYAHSSNGLPTCPVQGANIVDDSSGANQTEPVVVVSDGADGVNVVAVWRDYRNIAAGNNDSDIYFASLSDSCGTNVLVTDDTTGASQQGPSLGLDNSGNPYVLWTDGRNENNAIYYAAAMTIDEDSLAEQYVIAEAGGVVGTDPQSISELDDVSVAIPADAFEADVAVSIARIRNPKSSLLRKFSSAHEFGPSGSSFQQAVTVTIPYDIDPDDPSSYEAWWYNPQTGQVSKEGIYDEEHVAISPSLAAIRFKTTHFSQFMVGSQFEEGPGTDGCSMSRYPGRMSTAEMLLPWLVLAGFAGSLKYRNGRSAVRPRTFS